MKSLLSFLCMLVAMMPLWGEVVQYKDARIGTTSDVDIVFDIPPTFACDDLITLFNSYYMRHLEPVAQEREFTVAERRMFLLCAYAEMCNLSALWTGLACIYKRDSKEYACGAPEPDVLLGYVVDREKFYVIRNKFYARFYNKGDAYRTYVLGMQKALFDDFKFTDDETKRQLPTDVDIAIIKQVLCNTLWNDGESLRYLEKNYNENAILWDRYYYILRSNHFKEEWKQLRRYYERHREFFARYKRTFSLQARIQTRDLATERVLNLLSSAWLPHLEEVQTRVHRAVYDAPYCLLTTKLCHFIAFTTSSWGWLARSGTKMEEARRFYYMYAEQLSDTNNLMENLTTGIAVRQTGRVIELLKMAVGTNAYNALREQSKLLLQMETVK